MCLTLPVRIVAIDGLMATVESAGRQRTASCLALPEARVGDWAILAAGALVRILDAHVAQEMAAALRVATAEEISNPKGETNEAGA